MDATPDPVEAPERPEATTARLSVRPVATSVTTITVDSFLSPERLQMGAALLLGILLVALPLYFWRRPVVAFSKTADPPAETAKVLAPAAPAISDLSRPPASPSLHLGQIHTLSCHDPGPGKTPSDACDHLTVFEQTFAHAVEAAQRCAPGTGNLTYVADVSFGRKRNPVQLFAREKGGVFSSSRVVSACLLDIKRVLNQVHLEDLPHQHARYKIGLSAQYSFPKKL